MTKGRLKGGVRHLGASREASVGVDCRRTPRGKMLEDSKMAILVASSAVRSDWGVAGWVCRGALALGGVGARLNRERDKFRALVCGRAKQTYRHVVAGWPSGLRGQRHCAEVVGG